MVTRIAAIAAGLLLPPIGVLVFMHGAETNLRMFFLASTQGAFNPGPLIMLGGALIVGAAIAATRWSSWGILAGGAASALLGVLQFVFPFTMTGGSFVVAKAVAGIPRLFGVFDLEEPVLDFLLVGGALPLGAILIGAGLAVRAVPRPSALWLTVAVIGPVFGVIVLVIAQGMLVRSMQTLAADPAHIPGLVLGSIALGGAAYATRAAPFGLLAIAVPIAALGLLGVVMPDLWSIQSSPMGLPLNQSYVISRGFLLLYGVALLAASVAGLLRRRAVDAAPTAAV